MSNYESWLERQSELAKKALELIQKYGFRAVLIEEERKPTFVRAYIGKQSLDFILKDLKSEFIKSVWLCKREDFNQKANYLVFLAKEERWVIATGSTVHIHAEIKDSDYHKGIKYIVVPLEVFRPAIQYLKMIKSAYNESRQKRMSDWIGN